ncbi:MAG: DUF3105 domain-containing protein [Pseudolysinimonas sp.]|uniref:DUF3105 domain-containing protein n=1 Tax=Pseudolysinimonas sp. TaxID=2680009 RepID=UPI003266A37A
MATPPNRPAAKPPTVKEQRADKRALQMAAFKKQEQARTRTRRFGIIAAIVAIALVIGVVTTVVIVNANPPQSAPLTGPLKERVQLYPGLEATHVTTSVTYPQTPPVGGPHNPVWLNCGVYDVKQQNENAVHALEHGSVWITYDPATTSAAEITALEKLTPTTYAILSPYPGIGDQMAISAWGAQLRFTDVGDPTVQDFIEQYWRSPDSPEPSAPCTGGIDGPGKQS